MWMWINQKKEDGKGRRKEGRENWKGEAGRGKNTTKFNKAESLTNILNFWKIFFPTEESQMKKRRRMKRIKWIRMKRIMRIRWIYMITNLHNINPVLGDDLGL